MKILTYSLLLMTTSLGFSKSEPEIFPGLIFNPLHGAFDDAVMIAHQGSGREICMNKTLRA